MAKRAELSKRQAEVLAYIVKFIDERGYPPTMREIGEGMGIRSTNGVVDHLKRLVAKGYLERADTRSRAIKVVRDAAPEPARDELADVRAELAAVEERASLWESRARAAGWA